MRKLVRYAAIAIAVLAGFAVIALTALNLYVQSQGTQARIQQELSQRLKTPVRLDAVSVTPWGGLSLVGIVIPGTGEGNVPDFLTARSFHLHVSLLSLFSGKLIITKIALLNPVVIWPQDERGKWRLPGTTEKESSHPEREVEPPPAAIASATIEPANSSPSGTVVESSPTPIASVAERASAPAAAAPAKGDLVPDVRRINIDEGSFRFLDRAGKIVAGFEDVNFKAGVHKPLALRGNARIARMSVRDRIYFEHVQSTLRYDPDLLELSKISGQAGGGEVTGSFSLNPESSQSPFKVSFKFRDVEADQIVSDAGGPHGMIQGKLEGQFDGTGATSDPAALNGSGEIQLHDGQVQQYSLLVALGQILQIEELQQLHLEQAEAKYHVTPGLVTIDELVLRSPNIKLSATGTITFEGKLKLDSQLAINDKIRGQLFKPIRENFHPIAEAGYSAVEFQVGGTVDRPKTNLVEAVVGRDLKDIVSGFFGGGKKADKEKKKRRKAAEESENGPEPVVSPTPTAEESASPAQTP